MSGDFVRRIARAQIGDTYNQYADSALLRRRLRRYLDARQRATTILVGEAAGYRGARVSGLPFTSEHQITGCGASEVTATVVQRVLNELGIADDVVLWNVVPTHPGTVTTNRPPTRAEIRAARPFLAELTAGRRVIAVGRLAAAETGGEYVRHPAHGGAAAFREMLCACLT
jgi:uracil-DNA glycosylase